MNKFYIYMYLDLDNVPFYIGKGKADRYYVCCHLKTTNRLLKNKIRKVGVANVQVQFLHRNLTEEEALQQEKYWVKYYGRRDLGTGTLCNLTDGGEAGPVGYKHTKRALQKMRKAGKGRPGYWIGKKRSVETNEKISRTLTGKKLSQTHREKISKTLKNRYSKEDHPSKGRPAWNKGKKLSQIPWNKGKKLSQEHRRKISLSLKGGYSARSTEIY